VAKLGDTPTPSMPPQKGHRKIEDGPTTFPKNSKNKQNKLEGQADKAVQTTDEKQ
jgi:hypothetical protein